MLVLFVCVQKDGRGCYKVAEITFERKLGFRMIQLTFSWFIVFSYVGEKQILDHLSNVIPSFNTRILSFLTFQLNHFVKVYVI